jgi:NAD+ kinase
MQALPTPMPLPLTVAAAVNATDTLQAPFKRVGLVGKPAHTQTPAGLKALADVVAWLKANVDCWLETQTAISLTSFGIAHNSHNICELHDMAEHVDALVVAGGDGTMLAVARDLASTNLPLIGINQGQLGFMTDISLHDFADDLNAVIQGQYTLEPRSMIHGELLRDGHVIATALALNDAVISRGANASMVDVCVSIDGRLAYHLRADALVAATPTGSTAYALSANGPIVHPTVSGFVLVPVAPQTLSNRPIVLPDNSVIDITLESSSRGTGFNASFDMQQWQLLQANDIVRLTKSPLTATLVHPRSYDYYHTLRHKLHWTYNPINPMMSGSG